KRAEWPRDRASEPSPEFLELAVLREGIPRKQGTGRSLLHFDSNTVRGSGRSVRVAQDGKLRKYLVIKLCDQVVLTGTVVAPHLSQLDGLHCHIGTELLFSE